MANDADDTDDAAAPGGKARAELTRLARLSAMSVSDGTAAEVLACYVEEAVVATGATRGFVAFAETNTGGLELVATAGAGWTDAARRERLRERAGETITSQVAATGRCVRVDDLAGSADYEPFFPDVRSILAVPIALPGERVRGVINLESKTPGEFTPDEEAFVCVLADLAALRLASDDLRAREAALVQIGNELSLATDPDALMKKVADVAAEVLRFEDCSLFLIDQATRRAVLVATRGPLAPLIGRAAYEMGEGITGWVAEHGVPARTGNPGGDPRHKGVHREFPTEEIGAFLAVPIRTQTGVTGVLRVLRKRSASPWFPNEFTPEDEQVLSTIASQVGAAVNNAQLFARLVQAERMAAWGEMSAMSSHMIGNRVFAVKGDLNELEYLVGGSAPGGKPEGDVARAPVARLVESMKQGIFRLEELLAEFRDFVRATALSPVPLDLGELVRGAVEETFPRRGPVALVTDYTDEALPVLADAVKLKRALAEIVENAVTFQESGGSLRVTTRRLAPDAPLPARAAIPRGTSCACVEFADRGPGVPEETKTKIFRPFFTSRSRGMGLGLAIVKGIIEAHKGDIVEVGAPGEGARFLVFLPLREGS